VKLSEGEQSVPVIPGNITFAGFDQTMISGVLIFLFLLTMRNHFRIQRCPFHIEIM
jgi:hypothetical protein